MGVLSNCLVMRQSGRLMLIFDAVQTINLDCCYDS